MHLQLYILLLELFFVHPVSFSIFPFHLCSTQNIFWFLFWFFSLTHWLLKSVLFNLTELNVLSLCPEIIRWQISLIGHLLYFMCLCCMYAFLYVCSLEQRVWFLIFMLPMVARCLKMSSGWPYWFLDLKIRGKL